MGYRIARKHAVRLRIIAALALFAVPIVLTLAMIASGAGPVAGLYGAVFVGFFAALFGGTPSQISGPTGPMTVVMAAVVTQLSKRLRTWS